MYQSFDRDLTREEIAIIKAETRLTRFNFWFGLFKGVVLIGSVTFSFYIWWYLTKPKAEVEMKAERVKIVLEILKEKDPADRAIAVRAVRQFYEELNPLFADVDQSIAGTARSDLLRMKQELENNYRRSDDETEKRIIQTNIDEIDRLLRLGGK